MKDVYYLDGREWFLAIKYMQCLIEQGQDLADFYCEIYNDFVSTELILLITKFSDGQELLGKRCLYILLKLANKFFC